MKETKKCHECNIILPIEKFTKNKTKCDDCSVTYWTGKKKEREKSEWGSISYHDINECGIYN